MERPALFKTDQVTLEYDQENREYSVEIEVPFGRIEFQVKDQPKENFDPLLSPLCHLTLYFNEHSGTKPYKIFSFNVEGNRIGIFNEYVGLIGEETLPEGVSFPIKE